MMLGLKKPVKPSRTIFKRFCRKCGNVHTTTAKHGRICKKCSKRKWEWWSTQ